MADGGAIDLSIVIPAFNEADRLPPTLTRLLAFLGRTPYRWEIVVSDDGSTDATAERCRACALPAELRLVRAVQNLGKGHAVRSGMLAARGAIRVMYDADDSMSPAELPKLIEPVARGETHVAIGSRYLDGGHSEGQPLWRRAWSRFANLVMQMALVPGVRDMHCGYKAFSAEAATDVFGRATVNRWGFDLEVLALAKRLGHPVREVSIAWKDAGRSRVRLRDLPQTLMEVALIRVRLERQLRRAPARL